MTHPPLTPGPITRSKRLRRSHERKVPSWLPVAALAWVFATTITITPLARIMAAQPPVGITFALILTVSSTGLAVAGLRHSFSLQQIHWAFVYLFFYIAAVVQYDANRLSWGLSKFGSGDFFLANIVVLMWSISWAAGSAIRTSRRKHRSQDRAVERSGKLPGIVPAWIMIALLMGAALLNAIKYQREGLYGFLLRGAGTTFETSGSSSLALIIFTGQKVLPLTLTLAALWNASIRRSFSSRAAAALALALCLLANFPTATPRFWAATLIIGFMAHFQILVRRGTLITMLLGGVLFVFPALGQVRRLDGSATSTALARAPVTDSLAAGDFDAYSMIVWGLDYINSAGYSLGKNFMSAALFFVPRSVWDGKSLGTGRTIADAESLTFNNVSAPLPLESYWTVGLVGVVLVGAALGRLTARFDDVGHRTEPRSFAATFAYPFGLGLLFFMMRGDLLSSVAYGTALIGSILAISSLTRASNPISPSRHATGRAGMPKPRAL